MKDCSRHAIGMEGGKPVIINDTCNLCGHCIAVCPTGAVEIDDYDMNEVIGYDANSFKIEPSTLLNFIKFRRSVRQFTDERVAQKYLNEILESGRFTQTATNLQDVTYTVITQNIEILKQTCLETLHHMGKQILSEGSEKTSLMEKEYARYFIELYKAYKTDSKNDGLFYNAPAVIMVKSNVNWSINGALASSNMELMANALGLGTFHCGLLIKAAEQNEMIGQLAGVKNGEQLVACMPVGHPAVKYFRTVPRQKPSVNWQ
jgi:nitroreductase